MLTLAQPMATARTVLNDAEAVRYSEADLLRYANDALDVLSTMVPHLFHADGEVQCLAGKTMQSVGYADALRLVDVRRVKDGNVVTPADRNALDAYLPSWHSATPGAAVHWMAVPGDPVRFMVYPPAPQGQILEVMYVRIPAEYGVDEDTELPSTYSDAIADYIVYRAESRDDEHIETTRASQFMASFATKVKSG